MPHSSTLYLNAAARDTRLRRPADDILGFHQTLPGYAATPLVELPELAVELGVGRVFMKDESSRLGLPAFKVLGASYAISRVLSARWGVDDRALDLGELRRRAATDGDLHLYAATDGNHGRAVAHVARLLGVPATIFFPHVLTSSAKDAIRGEGATVVDLEMAYDDVVATMIEQVENAGGVIVQDTAWEGYVNVPQWIVDGYSTMLEEMDGQLRQANVETVSLVMAPAGVGSLAQAITAHFRSVDVPPSITIVEPVAAPTIFHALTHGSTEPIETGSTIMTGLNCGTPSPLAWPVLNAGADAAVLVDEDETKQAIRDLRDLGVDAGPCGAATLAGARRIIDSAAEHLVGVDGGVVILINTESFAANPVEDLA